MSPLCLGSHQNYGAPMGVTKRSPATNRFDSNSSPTRMSALGDGIGISSRTWWLEFSAYNLAESKPTRCWSRPSFQICLRVGRNHIAVALGTANFASLCTLIKAGGGWILLELTSFALCAACKPPATRTQHGGLPSARLSRCDRDMHIPYRIPYPVHRRSLTRVALLFCR